MCDSVIVLGVTAFFFGTMIAIKIFVLTVNRPLRGNSSTKAGAALIAERQIMMCV